MNKNIQSSLRFVLFATGVTAIGGFLFGYDTAVINGAISYLKLHMNLNAAQEGMAGASAIAGCVPGAMFAGFLSDRFGRRKMLFLCALLYAVSGLLSAIPNTFGQFLAARFLSGLGIGASSMICPVYIAEISPEKWRGRLGTLFQLGIVTGIFLTLFVNKVIQGMGDQVWNIAYGWRWMLGMEVVPAAAFLALLFAVPESPRWLAQRGRENEARGILEKVGGAEHAQSEMAAISAAMKLEEGRFGELFINPFRRPLLLAVALMAFSQFCGINAIIYYSTKIFAAAGGGENAAFTSRVGGPHQPGLHVRGDWFRGSRWPPSAAAHRHRGANHRARARRLDVSRADQRRGIADLRRVVHRRVCDGDGTGRLAVLLGNFSEQTARPRHVHRGAHCLDFLLHRGADVSDAQRQPGHRPGQNLLGLCRREPALVYFCADARAGNQRPHARTN
jgi:MFS family permease